MPNFFRSLRILAFRVAVAGVGLGLLAGASNAAPDWGIMEMRSDLKSLTARLNESGLERGASVRATVRCTTEIDQLTWRSVKVRKDWLNFAA